MLRVAKSAVAAIALVGGLFLVGCQSSHESSAQASSQHLGKDVVCNKCEANGTAKRPYTVPSYDGARVVGYFNGSGKACGHCEATAAKYAETGKLSASTCDDCGGSLKVSK